MGGLKQLHGLGARGCRVFNAEFAAVIQIRSPERTCWPFECKTWESVGAKGLGTILEAYHANLQVRKRCAKVSAPYGLTKYEKKAI